MLKEIESVIIFLLTMFLVIKQPKNIPIGISAVVGGVLSFLLGIVNINDIYEVIKLVWDASLAFIGIIFISVVLDNIGFFEWISLKAIDKANEDGIKLYVYMLLIGALISIFLANDGAALMLTPIVYSKIKHLNLQDEQARAYMVGGGFISDTASIGLVISNLTNIITADFFHISFLEYAKSMLLVNIVSIVSSIAVLLIYYKNHLPKSYKKEILEDKNPEEAIKDRFLFYLAWPIGALAIGLLMVSHIYNIPTSFIIIFAGILISIGSLKNKKVNLKHIIFKETPWQILIFSIGMYVVVFGLQKAFLYQIMPSVIRFFIDGGKFVAIMGVGVLSGVLSALINNLPTVMLINLNIKLANSADHMSHILALANLIGTDIGPKMTPIGSLATLLWLHVLNKKGLNISYAYYIKVGIILTIPVLILTLFSLYVFSLF
jgi:Na+/H+ antiporter NhaD and related arsenite permeases